MQVQQQLEKMKTRLEYDLEKEWPINCSEEFKITFRRLQKLIDDDDPYEHLTRYRFWTRICDKRYFIPRRSFSDAGEVRGRERVARVCVSVQREAGPHGALAAAL